MMFRRPMADLGAPPWFLQRQVPGIACALQGACGAGVSSAAKVLGDAQQAHLEQAEGFLHLKVGEDLAHDPSKRRGFS
jgi:hypothetical protein